MEKLLFLLTSFVFFSAISVGAQPEPNFTPNRFKNTDIEAGTGDQFSAAAIPAPSYSPYTAGTMVAYRDNNGNTYGNLMIKRVKDDGSVYTPQYVINNDNSASLGTYQITSSGAFFIVSFIRGTTIYMCRRDAAGAAYTSSAWSGYTNGKPIITTTYNKYDLSMVTDGANGAIISWREMRGSYYYIYAQRVDVSGNILWASNGRAVSTTSISSYSPKLIPSSSNSAIVAWYDNHGVNGIDIYAQRFSGTSDAAFTLMWNSGAPVGVTTPMAGDQSQFNMCPDDSGGAFFAFLSMTTDNDIFVQRINLNGGQKMATGGALVSSAVGNPTVPVMAPFSSITYGKSVYLAWVDPRNSGTSGNDIWATRINCTSTLYASGTWNTSTGVEVCNATGNQFDPKLTLDTLSADPGVLISWADPRDGSNNIYATRYTYTATRATGWTTVNGMAISEASGNQPYSASYPMRVWTDLNNNGDFIFLWTHSRNGLDLQMQKENQGGSYIDRVAPSVPTLLAEPNSNLHTPTLEWNAVSGASRYYFQLSTSATFSTLLLSDSMSGSLYNVPTGYLGNGTYYWHVRCRDDGDNFSDYSLADTFKVDTVAPTWSGFSIANNDTISSLMPYLRAIMADNGSIKQDSSTLHMTLDGDILTPLQLWPYYPNYVHYTPDYGLQDQAWHRVTWFVKDSAGNGGINDTAVINFFVDPTMNDNTAPTFSNPSPSPGPAFNHGTGYVTVNVSDPSGIDTHGEISITVNHGTSLTFPTDITFDSVNGLISTQTKVGFNQGVNQIDVVALDRSTNQNRGTFSWNFNVDDVNPDAPYLYPLPALTSNPAITVFGNGEPKATVQVYVGAGLAAACTLSAASTSYQFNNLTLAEGQNIVKVRQIDSAGNTGLYSSDTIMLDATSPAPPVLLASEMPPYTNTGSVLVKGIAERNSYIQVFNNGTQTAWQNMGAQDTFGMVISLGNGNNAITALQTDSAGNISAECTPVTVVMDVTAPVTDSTLPKMHDTLISQKPLLWSALHDLGGAGLNTDSLQFSLNDVPVTGTWDGVSRFSYSVPVNLTDKTWNFFKVRAADQAGNVLPGDSIAFYVDKSYNDNIPPVISSVSPTTSQTSPTPRISAVAADNENGLDESATRLFLDGVLKTHTYNGATGEVTFTPSAALSQGMHHCSLYVADASTNHNNANTAWTFLLDSDAPGVPQVTALTSPTNVQTVTVSGSTNEPQAFIQLFCNGTLAASGNASASGTFSLGPITLTNGNNSFLATAADSLNNASTYSPPVNVFFDNNRPAFVSLSPANQDTVSVLAPLFTFQVTDGSGAGVRPDSFFLQIGSATIHSSMISYSNGVFTYQDPARPFNNNDVLTYQAAYRDLAGNPSDTQVVTFVVDTFRNDRNPPVFSTPYPAPNAVVNNTMPQIRVNVSDLSGVDGGTLVFTLDSIFVSGSLTGSELKYQPTTALADGSHSMRIIASDLSPAHNTDSLKWTFYVDATAPQRPQVYPASSPTNSQQITVAGKSESKASVVLLRLSDTLGTVIADSTGNFQKAIVLNEGQNRVTAYAVDTAGNTSSISQAMTVVLDTRPPVISGAYPLDGALVSINRPVISATLSDSGGVVDSLQSYLMVIDKMSMADTLVGGSADRHGAAFNSQTGLMSWQPTALVPLKDNWQYLATYVVYDRAGNLQTRSVFFLTQFSAGDAEPPQITAMAPTGTVSSRTPEISAVVTDNTRLSLAGTMLKVDATPVAFSFDTLQNKLLYQSSLPMTEAVEHTIELTAKDTANNSKVQQWAFTIDATAPAAPFIDTLAVYSKTLSAPVIGRTEARATVEIVILGMTAGSAAANDLGLFNVPNTALSEGVNVVRAQAVDAAGNRGPLSLPDTIFADIRPPYMASSSPQSGARVGLLPQITAQVADTGKASGVNPATVVFFVDGAPVRTSYSGTSARVDTVLTLPAGSHTYQVQAADFAGNTLLSAAVSFITDASYVDNLPPVFSGQTPANNSRIGSARPAITVNISDASSLIDSASVKLLIELSPVPGYTFTRSTGLLSYTPATDFTEGMKNIMVIATDVPGNKDTVEWKFLVDLTPPAKPHFLTTSDTLVPSAFVTLQAMSQTGANVSLYRDSILISSIPALASDTFLLADLPVQKGINRFHLIAQDEVGNTSVPSETLNVVYNTAAPIIGNAGIGSVTAKEDSSFAFQIIVSDADGNRLYYHILVPVNADSFGMAVDSNGLFSWHPSLPAASMAVQIRVDDGFGMADTMLFLATANAVNDKPVFAGLTDSAVTRVDSVRIPFTLSDEDNATLSAFGVKNPPAPSMHVVHGTGNNYTLVFFSDSAFADTVRLYAYDGTDSTFAKLFVSVSLQAATRTLTFPLLTDTLRLALGLGPDTVALYFPYDVDIAGKLAVLQHVTPVAADSIEGNITRVGEIYDLSGLDSGFTCRLVLPIPSAYTGSAHNLMIFRRANPAAPWRALRDLDTGLRPFYVAAWLTGFSQYVLGLDTAAPRLRIDSVNAGLVVCATLTENILNPEVALWYRAGGAAPLSKKQVVLTVNGTATVRDTVPASFASTAANGFEFWLSATDGNHTAVSPHRSVEKALAGAALPATAVSAEQFRMVSLPFLAGAATPDSILAALITADDKEWRIGRWFATGVDQGSYVDHAPGSTDAFLQLRPGNAVWVYAKNAPGSPFPVHGSYSTPLVRTDSVTQGYEVSLLRGWNQVGNPYPFPIRAADVRLDTHLVQDVFYAWLPTTQAYAAEDTLEPYTGYWVLANAPTTLLFPSLPPGTALGRVLSDSLRWTAELAIAGKGEGALIRVGEGALGTELRDNGLDLVGPPSITGSVRLSVPHKEWKQWGSSAYVQDIRDVRAEGNVWDARATRSAGLGAAACYTLALRNPEKVPGAEALVAYFPAENMVRDLRKGNVEVALAPGETTAEFRIVAGSADYVARNTLGAQEAPATTDLTQNAPNPFNPSTRIRYQVQKAGNVSVTVYDLRGRVVVQLANRFHKAGYYTVPWNGNTRQGLRAASGMYVYRMESGKFAKTRRMILVK
ncbi:MAG: T9SS type A sorting domain-containing protein [Fibrobacterota bacterium]